MEIKPIETRYKGYRFRSRLEARWAVFLDSLRIAWNYEPQGFHLPDGTNYLPDFWLPDAGIWLEIKGQDPSEEEMAKAVSLRNGSGCGALVLSGTPGESKGVYFGWTDRPQKPPDCRRFVYGLNSTEVAPLILVGTFDPEEKLFSDRGMTRPVHFLVSDLSGLYTKDRQTDTELQILFSESFERAKDAARSARFEFGESGPG